MDKNIAKRFDLIDESLYEVKSSMQNHMTDDHHVIVKRFDNIDKVIKSIQDHINTKKVGYSGLIVTIITLITVIIGVL